MERLQKVLARAGIASRRAAEEIILAGRVRVDGRIVRELGTQVDERRSRVEVDGTKIVAEKLIYIVLHKPRGVVCTLSDPEGRPTIRELLKEAGARVVPVGRLDFHTSGALLCTNDGEFAQGLAHPKREVPKVYVAKVKGTVEDDQLEAFSQRIEIDGRPTQPAQVKRLRFEGDKTWLEITLREGRNRQVRRLGEATGFPVMRLARISHAGVSAEDLRPGQWRALTVDELVDLKKTYGVPKKVRAPEAAPVVHRKDKRDHPSARGAAFNARSDTLKGQRRTKRERPAGDARDEAPRRAAAFGGRDEAAPRARASSGGRERAPRGRQETSARSDGREAAPRGKSFGGREAAPRGKSFGGREAAPRGKSFGGREAAPRGGSAPSGRSESRGEKRQRPSRKSR